MAIRTTVDDLPEQIKLHMINCLQHILTAGLFDWEEAIQYFLDTVSPWSIRRDPITTEHTKDIIGDFSNFCKGIHFLIDTI